MSSTLIYPSVTDGELGPPADPSAPWYVDEISGPLPPSVADGTWPFVYPERSEGPRRVIGPAHDHYDAWLGGPLHRHVQRTLLRAGQGYVARNVYLELEDGRMFGPDFAFYAALPADFHPTDGRKGVQVARQGPPDLVLEILSSRTWQQDVGEDVPDSQNKLRIYAEIGVTEYWIVNPHDPEDNFAPHIPRLQGFRWEAGGYARIPANAAGRYPSTVLATDWGIDEGEKVRLWDPARQAWYPDPSGAAYDEEIARLHAKNAQQHAEITQKDAEITQKDAEIARLTAVSEQARTDRVEALLEMAFVWEVLTTPQEQVAYRAKLQGVALDQLPPLSAFREHLQPWAAGPARTAAGKRFLDRLPS